ncbi:MAG: transketolase C-terminal domain-containing protein [Nanoarchaeota archaeon]|nr:transketolase C-terminal domain-containing protein [Nanoarchaeota archaeon]
MGSLNSTAYLALELYSPEIKKVKTRDGYGKGLVKAGEKNPNVVVLSADLTESTRSHWFKEKFPQRFVEIGVAEQNLASVASGMAAIGKIPFISSYAVFSPGRNNEQIRTTISYNSWESKPGREINVKIGGAHAGISVGPDGATHQALEDVALMRIQPGMTVLVPCDANECEKATVAAAEKPGPVYIRFGRASYPIITTEKTPFKIGTLEEFRSGKDCTIVANGPLLYQALLAAKKLEKEIDCQVLNGHTVKPLDEKTLLSSVKKTGCVVTAEEHQWHGGLAGAVAEFLGENYPVPIKRVGVKDRFGESGEPEELLKAFGLTADDIVKAVRAAVKMKKK